MLKATANWLAGMLIFHFASHRWPNLIVGKDNPEGPYLLRWYITPWRGWFQGDAPRGWRTFARFVKSVTRRCLPNLYLHKFLRDDDDRALHDHPSWAISFILRNGYVEHTIAQGGIHRRREFGVGALRFMRAGGPKEDGRAHRIELLRDAEGNPIPCWTLLLFGPTVRDWGFHCPKRGWVPWQEFTADGKPGEVGKGCDA